MPPRNILLVASEVFPFSKTGGLADVLGSLPKALKQRGHDVRVVTPRYYNIDRHHLHHVTNYLPVPLGNVGTIPTQIFESRLGDVPIYFIDYEPYFGRKDLYNDPYGQGYPDNDLRFICLSRAALELAKAINFHPDVVHVNDWQTSPIPVFLNSIYRYDPHFHNTASILTIHNAQYQGSFSPDTMNALDVGWEHFHHRSLEHYGQTCLLKGGIYHSTLITAVSEGYAREIQTPEYAYGLDSAFRDRTDDLYGIVNGIDEDEWNPAADPFIASNYSADNLHGKFLCKRNLQQTFGLPPRDVPIIGMITRLVDQKGVDVVAAALPQILTLDLQVVLLGSGEPWAQQFFRDASRQYHDRFRCYIGYDTRLSHKIEAGADFFLMPSRFEPCGLNQLYSQRYGTLPIVRATGGLDDTVENFNEHTLEGTGFKFHTLDPRSLFNTVGWATHTYYHNPHAMHQMIRRCMAKNFSWHHSAYLYSLLYEHAIARRRR